MKEVSCNQRKIGIEHRGLNTSMRKVYKYTSIVYAGLGCPGRRKSIGSKMFSQNKTATNIFAMFAKTALVCALFAAAAAQVAVAQAVVQPACFKCLRSFLTPRNGGWPVTFQSENNI